MVRYEINRKNFDLKEKFSWAQVKLAALDWKTWSHSVNQFCVDVTLYVSSPPSGPSVAELGGSALALADDEANSDPPFHLLLLTFTATVTCTFSSHRALPRSCPSSSRA